MVTKYVYDTAKCCSEIIFKYKCEEMRDAEMLSIDTDNSMLSCFSRDQSAYSQHDWMIMTSFDDSVLS